MNTDALTQGASTAISFLGGCVCGEIRYECGARPLRMFNCHCRDCQQIGGGPYAPIVVVPLSAFHLRKGELHRCSTMRINGQPNLRGFCGRCGSRISCGEDHEHDVIGLMAGSLDAPASFKPSMDIFVCDAQPWDIVDATLPKHQQYMSRK